MKGLKFVVTGGAGLIGSWVVDYILSDIGNKVREVIILDDFSRGKKII